MSSSASALCALVVKVLQISLQAGHGAAQSFIRATRAPPALLQLAPPPAIARATASRTRQACRSTTSGDLEQLGVASESLREALAVHGLLDTNGVANYFVAAAARHRH